VSLCVFQRRSESIVVANKKNNINPVFLGLLGGFKNRIKVLV
jgi:hypothetical protein